MDFEIREMTIDDYEEVAALWKATDGVWFDEDDEVGKLDAYLRRNPGLSFVARCEGRVVATVQCGHDARRGYLHHLAVAPNYRRQGLGAALVERSLARLAELGIPQCNINVLGDNQAGLKFWESTGWEPGTPEGLMLLHKRIRD
jgi:ribosomal protein S18 acetylase RimI-like enzyme